MTESDIVRIASMLDDEDENVGVNLLAQLIARADELGDLPGILQESSDPVVRRRAHQLQSALNMRRRREDFHRRIFSASPELIPGLEELHLLWFDRDSAAGLREMVDGFCKDFLRDAPRNVEDIECFMRKRSLMPAPETTIVPENYCIGTVLDRHTGATSLLLALGRELAGNPALQMVMVLDEFGLYDRDRGLLLTGGGTWKLCRVPGTDSIKIWDNRMILQYISGILLSCAVNSDSYRYVMSIAQAVSGDRSEHVFDAFPYPFRTEPEDEETEDIQ